MATDVDMSIVVEGHGQVTSAQTGQWGTMTLIHEDGWKSRVTFDIPLDELMREAFQLLALILPIEVTFKLHHLFLEKWST